jgi:hypothetical protein
LEFVWDWFHCKKRKFNFYFIQITSLIKAVKCLFELSQKNPYSQYYANRYSGLRNLLEEFLNKKTITNYDTDEEKFRTITFNLCEWNYKDGSLTKEFFNKFVDF